MPGRRILLVRHGQTAWNAIGKLQGATDIPLNDLGREQARGLAAQLAGEPIAQVWASDLARASETAAIVATNRGLAAPRIDPELRERAFGVFEGLTRDECEVNHPEAWQSWMAQTGAPPGGEARELAAARMGRALARIVAAATDPGPTLVVSHGGIMRLWLIEQLGADVPMIPNAAVCVVEVDGERLLPTLW